MRCSAFGITESLVAVFALALIAISAACGSGATSQMSSNPPGSSPVPPGSPVLLYVGTGTSPNDVVAWKTLLGDAKLSYTTADEHQLNADTVADLRSHQLLIIPGGNSITIGTNLAAATSENIRQAVQQGLHYLGVCAGAFFGAASIYNGVDLTSGVWFNFYAAENQGIHKAAVDLSFSDGSVLDMYWEDGPQLSGWGEIVAKFPDGTPAITQGTYGKGFVLFTGIHAEAPADWRTGLTFTTPVQTDLDYAATLLQAALQGAPLPHF